MAPLRPRAGRTQVVETGTILVSDALVAELIDVLARPIFADLVGPDDARAFAQALGGIAERVEVTAHVAVCRDPQDDHVLALAVAAEPT